MFEKNAGVQTPTGALAQLLTTYRVFQLLKEDMISLNDKVEITPQMARRIKATFAASGSNMQLEAGQIVTVGDLLRGMIVNSANDATLVLAIHAGKTETAFTEELNDLISSMGLKETTITNPVGWNERNQAMSVRDLAVIATRLIADFPEYYHYFSEKEFNFRPNAANNDNPNKILWIMPASDGLKTSFSAKFGFGLVASTKRGNRRLIVATAGLRGSNASLGRFTEGQHLLNWGFRTYSNYVYYRPGDTVAEIPVWFGSRSRLKVGVSRPVIITAPAGENPTVAFRAQYRSPLPAPIAKGDVIGRLTMKPGSEVYDLVALESTVTSGFIKNIFLNIRHSVLRLMS